MPLLRTNLGRLSQRTWHRWTYPSVESTPHTELKIEREFIILSLGYGSHKKLLLPPPSDPVNAYNEQNTCRRCPCTATVIKVKHRISPRIGRPAEAPSRPEYASNDQRTAIILSSKGM
eukprot:scaffold82350_cov23-Prasinocladus_malaysianus.AAC.1